MTCYTVRGLLEPLLDNELDAGNKADVETHLQGCAACAEVHHKLSELRTTVRAGAPYYNAPEHLKGRVRAALRENSGENEAARRRSVIPWRWAAASAVAGFALASVIAIVMIRRNTPQSDLIAQEVVSSHVRSLLPGHLMDVPSSDQHTVKPWFAGKVDFSPRVKELKMQGFELKGARLDYINNRTVAAIVFQRRQHVINLFVWPEALKTTPAMTSFGQNGFNIIRWSSGGLEYWAISDLNAEELGQFARLYAD